MGCRFPACRGPARTVDAPLACCVHCTGSVPAGCLEDRCGHWFTGGRCTANFARGATMADERNQDPEMDAAGLYREEMITDRKVGAIRQLTPVTADGAPDTTRPVVFVGQAEIMTNMGPVPLSFEIEGKTLAD